MILSGQRLPYEEQLSDADSSEGSSSEDTLDSRTELQQILLDVKEIIDNFYDLSVTIRASAPREPVRVRMSINVHDIETQETKYVESKFPHLRRANFFLLKRLARSNADRWQAFRDLNAHHKESTDKVEQGTDPSVDHWRRHNRSGDAGALHTLEGEGGSHYATKLPFNAQASINTLHENVAEALSDDCRSITSSAASDDREVEGELHIPQPPNDALAGESFKCIYCYKTILGSARSSWRQVQLHISVMLLFTIVHRSHVYKHLRPYICTSNECKTPFKTYATRDEWFEHEAQIHRRQWFCQACLLTFRDELAFVEHQRAHHADSFAEWQLPALSDLFSRPADRDVSDTCPLCSKPGQLIRSHLAYHMRELALHVLAESDMRDNPDTESMPALPELVDEPRGTELRYTEQTSASPENGPSEISYTRASRLAHSEVQSTTDFDVPGAYPKYHLSAQEYLTSRIFSR